MKKFYTIVMILSGLLSQLSGGSVNGYRSLCGEGDVQGCYHLGVAYSKGDGVHKSLKNARRFLEFACDEGSEQACDELSDIDKNHIDSRNLGDKQDNSGDNNRIKEYVLGVIKHGSAQFDYRLEAMSGGMASDADAEYAAEYVSGGMRGEEPPSFAVCAVCHGADGRGDGGFSADLLKLKGLKKEGYLSTSNSQNKVTASRAHSLPIQVDSHKRKVKKVTQYTNERFGFTLVYPTNQFVIKNLSDNGDGITLYNADRSLQLKAYGSWYGDNIREIYRDELEWAKEAGQKVTYKVLKKNWFVLSGIDKKKQTIFYKKTYFRAGKSTSFRFEYPVKDKAKYNSLVSIINKNFKVQ